MPGPDHTAFRIIDANLNRAREALRVMEDYARFGLDDARLSAALKQARHALAEALPPAASEALPAYRDVAGDVGREVGTLDEYTRPHAGDVVVAAGKRLSEALRAIEEYGKTLGLAFPATVEKIRYGAYELDRRLALTIRARERFGGARLYVLLTESLCAGGWFRTAEAALTGGADVLQLREKNLPDREVLRRARRLAALCRERDTILVVNDRPDLALLSGARGVHLGQHDVTVAEARRMVPATAIIGVSTHNRAQVAGAAEAAPDYLAVGPMFATPTKPQEHLAGPAALTEARRQTSLPLVAIGGINPDNAREVLAATPCCVGVCRAVISQPDVAAAASRLRACVEEAFRRPATSGSVTT